MIDPDERRDSEERDARRRRRQGARKERVLHTRISEELSEDIRRMAEDLRVPVSNIVRNVLEEAFSVMETVTDNVGDLIEDVVDEAEAAAERIRRQRRRRHARPDAAHRAPRTDPREVEVEPDAPQAPDPPDPPRGPSRPAEDPDVLGWQPLLLARPQTCAECGASLERGDQAYAAVTTRGLGSLFACPDCIDERA